MIIIPMEKSQGSSVGMATGYGLEIRVQGFDFWRRLGIFLFFSASRLAVGPIQLPIQ
jgi:hypothetical protein